MYNPLVRTKVLPAGIVDLHVRQATCFLILILFNVHVLFTFSPLASNIAASSIGVSSALGPDWLLSAAVGRRREVSGELTKRKF